MKNPSSAICEAKHRNKYDVWGKTDEEVLMAVAVLCYNVANGGLTLILS